MLKTKLDIKNIMPVSKRGQVGTLGALVGLAVTFGVAVIAAALIADIVTNVRSTQAVDSLAFNVSTQGLTGITNFANQFPTVGLIAITAVIISLVVGFLAIRQQ